MIDCRILAALAGPALTGSTATGETHSVRQIEFGGEEVLVSYEAAGATKFWKPIESE